jgi:hypothetical protein
MLAFVIPFRSKQSSNNWEYHSQLLNRTIQSICNQTNKDYRVIVVYTDLPENKIEHGHVFYLHFPYSFLNAREITDFDSYVKQYYTETYAQIEMDQARRIIYGCKHAIEQQCTYIMSVDADDLVSNKIASFISNNENSEDAGWYVNKGYVYLEGKNFVYRYNKNLNQFCGSTNIIRADLVSIPDLESRNLLDFNFFSSHAWLKDRLQEYKNAAIRPLPFRGVVYVLNDVSWTNYGASYKGKGLKKWAKLFLLGQLINKKLRMQFGVYSIGEANRNHLNRKK